MVPNLARVDRSAKCPPFEMYCLFGNNTNPERLTIPQKRQGIEYPHKQSPSRHEFLSLEAEMVGGRELFQTPRSKHGREKRGWRMWLMVCWAVSFYSQFLSVPEMHLHIITTVFGGFVCIALISTSVRQTLSDFPLPLRHRRGNLQVSFSS